MGNNGIIDETGVSRNTIFSLHRKGIRKGSITVIVANRISPVSVNKQVAQTVLIQIVKMKISKIE